MGGYVLHPVIIILQALYIIREKLQQSLSITNHLLHIIFTIAEAFTSSSQSLIATLIDQKSYLLNFQELAL